MAEYTIDLPPGYGVPTVDLATDRLPTPTMNAIAVDTQAAIAPVTASVTAVSDRTEAPPLGAKHYDARTGLYNYKAKHFRKIKAGLARAEANYGNICRIINLGSSITAGQGAVIATQAFPEMMRDQLIADGCVAGGTGIIPAHHGDSGYDTRWTRTGSWSVFTASTQRSLLLQGGSGSTTTFTADKPGTIVNLYYSNLSAAFTVSIDGATAVNVTPAGGATIGTYTVSGLGDTTHTVLVTCSGTTYILGAETLRASGLSVSNLGIGGARASDIRCLDAKYGALEFTVDRFPDLITIGVMTNDANTAVTKAAFKADIQQVVLRASQAGSDLLLIAEIPANGQNLVPYREAMYEIADASDLPLLDMYDRWGTYALANQRGLMFDAFHPRASGYKDYARAVRDTLHV